MIDDLDVQRAGGALRHRLPAVKIPGGARLGGALVPAAAAEDVVLQRLRAHLLAGQRVADPVHVGVELPLQSWRLAREGLTTGGAPNLIGRREPFVVEDARPAEGVPARKDVRSAEQPETDGALQLGLQLLRGSVRLGLLPHADLAAQLWHPTRRLVERQQKFAVDLQRRHGAPAGH